MVNEIKIKKAWYKRPIWIFLMIVVVALLAFGCLVGYQFYKIFKNRNVLPTAPYDMAKVMDPTAPWIGSADAPITIVEFGDFNCAGTKKVMSTLRELESKYKGKIKIYWRNLPVIAETSPDLARAAICAHKQGKFWPFHDRLFQLQGTTIDETILAQLAQKVGLNVNVFKSCFQSKIADADLKKDFLAAQAVEAKKTPTFYVNGYKMESAIPLSMWESIITMFLKADSTTNTK